MKSSNSTLPPHAGEQTEATTAEALNEHRGERPIEALPLQRQQLGANYESGRTTFRVWAPNHEAVRLHVVKPCDGEYPMERQPDGYHLLTLEVEPGSRYFYRLGNVDRPDPASRFQPDGVHAASEVFPSEFEWQSAGWKGLPLEAYTIYELHPGTFTPEGRFESIIPRLDALKELGITAIELLPVAQFPGERNWGYDGVYTRAAQNSYGGPAGLKKLVDACHARGMAVVLDVVYNHLGPEGNYLTEYGPYFTDRYKTAWGPALNFDGPLSDHVRWYFIDSALQWVDEFRIDALRVDAVHAIVDHSAQPFLQDLTTAVRERAETLGRQIYTIAESDLNDPRVITPASELGLGFDSQWTDDFHHSLHTVLTGERDGYYQGFGKVADLATTLQRGYLFVGQHSAHRGRKYGVAPKTNDGRKFVVCAQNHDQVGNRMLGERLSALVSRDQLKLIAAAVVLSPFIPMLFMGEEYGETNPFQYFTSHSDRELIDAVRKGRHEEFSDFAWEGESPDPNAEETFARSKLQWERREDGEHGELLDLYRRLFELRRSVPALRTLDLSQVQTHADDDQRTLVVRRGAESEHVYIAFNFSDQERRLRIPGKLEPVLETGAREDAGELVLPPSGFAVLRASRG